MHAAISARKQLLKTTEAAEHIRSERLDPVGEHQPAPFSPNKSQSSIAPKEHEIDAIIEFNELKCATNSTRRLTSSSNIPAGSDASSEMAIDLQA